MLTSEGFFNDIAEKAYRARAIASRRTHLYSGNMAYEQSIVWRIATKGGARLQSTAFAFLR